MVSSPQEEFFVQKMADYDKLKKDLEETKKEIEKTEFFLKRINDDNYYNIRLEFEMRKEKNTHFNDEHIRYYTSPNKQGDRNIIIDILNAAIKIHKERYDELNKRILEFDFLDGFEVKNNEI